MNSNLILFSTIFLTMIILNRKVAGQLTGSNLAEYQLGNIPDVKPADLGALYDQLNMLYTYKKLKISSRIEQFYNTDSTNRDYILLSQFVVRYQYQNMDMRAGNFNETLGRGLLLRSFEIPSSIIEDRIYRVRQGFYRDIQGFSFRYTGNKFRVKALLGKPLNNVFPPGDKNRRTELTEGIEPEIILGKQSVGMIIMRHSMDGEHNTYSGLTLHGNLPFNLSYYTEYDRNVSINANPLQFGKNDSYGIYFSLNHYFGNYGASLELKKYHNLLIGSGISDPPTLVKEHSYHLLNRSTHVIDLTDETGYQAEIYYHLNDGKMFTLNHSLSESRLGKTFMFYEYFLEFYWPFITGSSVKSFIDFSRDDLFLEDRRYSCGINYIRIFKNNYSATLEGEVQLIHREFNDNNPVKNIYTSISLAKSTRFLAGISYEFTTDRRVSDRPTTTRIEKSRHFAGVFSTYRPDQKNSIMIFAGERRGGPACTSGICYEVLDFRGAEIRWTLRF